MIVGSFAIAGSLLKRSRTTYFFQPVAAQKNIASAIVRSCGLLLDFKIFPLCYMCLLNGEQLIRSTELCLVIKQHTHKC